MYKPALVTGIIAAASAVIFGAFGAHGLKSIVPAEQVSIFEKGVTYQFYHSFALIITSMLHTAYPNKTIRIASLLFIIGILLFSGSLYLMTGLNAAGNSIGAAGIITPVGGLSFIVGWITLLAGILKHK